MIPLAIVSAVIEGFKDKREPHYYTTRSCKGEGTSTRRRGWGFKFTSTGLCKRNVGIQKGQNGILLVCVRFFILFYILHTAMCIWRKLLHEIREGSRRSRCLGPVETFWQDKQTGLKLTWHRFRYTLLSRWDRDNSMDFRGSTCQILKTPVTIYWLLLTYLGCGLYIQIQRVWFCVIFFFCLVRCSVPLFGLGGVNILF